jgi:hypothetical protein
VNHMITPEMRKAFADGNQDRLDDLLNLKPWQQSPLEVHYGKPPDYIAKDEWHKAVALRKKLEAA